MRKRTLKPNSVARPDLAARSHVTEAIDTLVKADELGIALPLPEKLTADELEFATRIAARKGKQEFDELEFARAMAKTERRIVTPRVTEFPEDLELALLQPEVLGFWGRWFWEFGQRGGKPTLTFAKGLMAKRAFDPRGAHMNVIRRDMCKHAAFKAMLERIDRNAPIDPAIRRRLGVFRALENTQTMDQQARLSPLVFPAVLIENISMLQELCRLFPEEDFCEVGSIDGSWDPFWIEQTGSATKQPEVDRRLRQRIPKAGYRAMGRDEIYTDPKTGKSVLFRKIKEHRGATFIALVQARTSLVLAWTLWDSAWDEAKALKELLYLLFEYWPDCPLRTIVADAAWDERWAYEYCETQGVHLVAARSRSKLAKTRWTELPENELIHSYDNLGRVRCRAHRKLPVYEGAESGKAQRLRFRCLHGCGNHLSLRMDTDWSALTYYPHYYDPRPEAGHSRRYHATRLALLTRRNTVESLFSAFKVRHLLGTEGEDRERTQLFEKHVALFSLAAMLRTAFLLGSARLDRDSVYQTPKRTRIAA